RWWRPEEIEVQRGRNQSAFLESYLAVFDAAVAAHLPATGDVGAMMSGGLDSTAVVASAAAALRGTGRRVTSYVSAPVPGFVGPATRDLDHDETAIAHSLAASIGGVDIEPVRNERHVLDIDFADDQAERTWLPYRNPANLVWMREIMHRAYESRLPAVLTGQTGNATFSSDRPDVLAELFVSGRLGTVIDGFRSRSRATGVPVATLLRSTLVRPFVPEGVLAVYRGLRNRRTVGSMAIYLDSVPFAKGAVERFGDEAVLRAMRNGGGLHDSRRFGWLAWMRMSPGLDAAFTPAGYWGVVYADPLGTRALVDAVAALPPEAWLIEGRTRAVARAAMKGRVPDPIRLRVRRGTQAPDWFLWARNRLPDYLRAVEDIGQSALVSEIIDVPLLRDRVSKWPLEQAAQRPPITDHSTTRAIGVGLFVRWWERRNAVV
ncbi:MAG: asparagine synthase-related protein, partial [Actinomycetes bacterium]